MRRWRTGAIALGVAALLLVRWTWLLLQRHADGDDHSPCWGHDTQQILLQLDAAFPCACARDEAAAACSASWLECARAQTAAAAACADVTSDVRDLNSEALARLGAGACRWLRRQGAVSSPRDSDELLDCSAHPGGHSKFTSTCCCERITQRALLQGVAPVRVCLPSLLIMGTPKAGTTCLWRALASSDAFLPNAAGVKETSALIPRLYAHAGRSSHDNPLHAALVTLASSRQMCDVRALRAAFGRIDVHAYLSHLLPADAGPPRLAVDVFPYAASAPGVPCLLRHVFPYSHAVLLTRAPAARAWSEYAHAARQRRHIASHSTAPSVLDALKHVRAFDDCVRAVAASKRCMNDADVLRTVLCMNASMQDLTSLANAGTPLRSMFAWQQQSLVAVFGAAHVTVLEHGDVTAPDGECDDARALHSIGLKQRGAGATAAMPVDMRSTAWMRDNTSSTVAAAAMLASVDGQHLHAAYAALLLDMPDRC